MTSLSPVLMSPASFLGGSENSYRTERRARSDGQLPLQQQVSSASQMPASPARTSVTSLIASNQYLEQHRTFVEHQRNLHNEERALWHLERQELHSKISELEATIAQLQLKPHSDLVSPRGGVPPGTFGSFSSNRGSQTTSGSAGDEFWRGAGGKSDSIPTRTFSESSDFSTTIDERRMPSIAENDVDGTPIASQAPISRQISHESSNSHQRSSIDGAKIDKNLDGISFKTAALPPFILKSVLTPRSPSPLQSPLSTRHSPQHLELSASNILEVDKLYTKDAGHTPLARGASVYSNGTSDQPTPRLTDAEEGRFEPRPSIAVSRPPNERSDSYFPPPPETIDEAGEDPELKGPLTLQNDKSEDTSFLGELDHKLLQVARSTTFSPSESSESEGPDKENKSQGDDKSFDQPESEPKLRIKRSMNFGSQFGAKNCGKGL
ncbi:hypothetical protein MMC11_006727 [Xylographa trunciseda]|nr:hypothetical protein [Xylographa trunciseda]